MDKIFVGCVLSSSGSVGNKYPSDFFNKSNKTDEVFEQYFGNEILKLGKKTLKISNNVINIRNKQYNGSNGFYELIFIKNPKKIYSDNDMKEYKGFLEYTDAYKNNSGKIKANRDKRYKNIIIQLIKKKGTGKMQTASMMSLKPSTEYIYYYYPNELNESLKLLISEKAAGHTGHGNEIVYIIEELRECGLIEVTPNLF